MTLELGESWPAWHPDVRRATWTMQGVETPVLVVLGPHLPGAVAHARREAASATALRGKHVLPLLGVEATGREVAWLYPFEVSIALSRIPAGDLDPKAIAEIVRDVARTLVDQPHPGPLPDQVLLDGSGTVRIAHFVGPWEPSAAWRAPTQPAVTGGEAVYRLGLFTASLLGTKPVEIDGALAHDAFLRGVLAFGLEEGGDVGELVDLLRDLLAWDPRDRPPLTEVVRRMGDIARSAVGGGLAKTTSAKFSSWLMPYRSQPEAVDQGLFDLAGDAYETMERTPHRARTLDGENILGDLSDEDEPTVDSELGIVSMGDRTPSSIIEFGSLPLRVGPPPGAVRRRPSLPPGFIGAPATEPTEVESPPETPAWLDWVAILFILLAVGLTIALLYLR